MNELAQQIEWACRELYTTTDPAIRVQAEKTCASLSDRSDCVALGQYLLDRADSCYSQFIATSSLTKFVSNTERVVHAKHRLELRNFGLNYLTNRPNLDHFVQQALITLVCRLTKTGWFDSVEDGPSFPFRDILESAQKFIWSGQLSAVLIGVQILSNLVDEISHTTDTDFTRAIFYMRKLSLSFRETALFQIFQLGLEMLRRTDEGLSTFDTSNNIQLQVVQCCLRLVVSCLSYDFVGTSIGGGVSGEPGGDDASTVQLPTAWRPVFLDVNNVKLFFRLFLGLPRVSAAPQLHPLILSCLVKIASIRRTLFTNSERQTFLEPLVLGCVEALRDQARRESLFEQSPASLHGFCRLLSRVKSTFQLNELLQVPVYPEFIQLITDFTIHILNKRVDDTSDGGSNNSLHYLLVLWQGLVASIPYVRTSEPFLIDGAAPQVTRAFIASRLARVPNYVTSGGPSSSSNAVAGRGRNKRRRNRPGKMTDATSVPTRRTEVDVDLYNDAEGNEDNGGEDLCPLDDEATLTQQLEQFSVFGRCDYVSTCELLANLFDQSFGQLQSALNQLVSAEPSLAAAMAATTITVPTATTSPAAGAAATAGSGFNGESPVTTLVRTTRIEENRLVWLVYMMGALVKSRKASVATDADQLDSELIARVLRLVQFGDARLQFMQQQQSSVCGASAHGDVANLLMGLSDGAAIRLEVALISFLDNFRRIYVGESVGRVTKMYQKLNELVGVGDEQAVLQLIVAKVLSNLRYWSGSEAVLEPTLELFGALASSYSAMKKLLQLDDVNFMLINHTPQNFRFLCSVGPPSPLWRYRGEFYAYLSRIMLISLSGGTGATADDNAAFLRFLAPLTEVVNKLISNLLLSDTCSLSQEEARSNVIGLTRDLSGVAFSLNTMVAFQLFLDWFYPSLFSLFGRAIEVWPFDPQVTCPLLKLLAEVVQNRNDRLKFEGTLPMGYLLLAETAKILINFGPQAIPFFRHCAKDNLYSHKVKPLTRYLDVLRITLSGRFANFAIFGLVGDDSIEKTVKLSTEVLLCVTDEELKSFPKLSKSYFALVECLLENHIVFLSSLDPAVIRQIFSAITIGVESLDASATWSACSCLDYLFTHLYKLSSASSKVSNGVSETNDAAPQRPLFVPTRGEASGAEGCGSIAQAARLQLTRSLSGVGACSGLGGCSALAIWSDLEEAGNANLRNHFLSSSASSQEFTARSRHLIAIFLASFMNDECKNQWSISRPLLCLILLNQEYFANLQSTVINSVTSEQRTEVEVIFRKLMEDVENSLTAKNRDKFTQNISAFRHGVTEFMKSVSVMALRDHAPQSSLDGCESFSLRDIVISVATSNTSI